MPDDILRELIIARISHAECNAGCVFDTLTSPLYPTALHGLRLILSVLPTTRVQLLLFQGLTDAEGFPVCKPIEVDNYEKLMMDTF